jgi:MFS transporter, OPA family, glycerol-3-phosphate transporter
MQPVAPLSPTAPAASPSPARSFAYYRNATFMALLTGYVGYYLCRQNFSAAYGPMSTELGMSKETFGLISTVGTAAYALGKFISGPIADSLGGRRVFLLGLFGSAAVSLFFGVGTALVVLATLWAANRLLQSLGWSGLVNVMPRWFAPSRYGTAMGAISVSYQVGAVVAPLVVGVFLSFGAGWRVLFIGPALMLIAIGLLVRPFLFQSPTDVGHVTPVDLTPGPASAVAAAGDLPLTRRLLALVSRPAFVAVLGLSFVLTLLREVFGLWMPAYFSDHGASAQAAAFKSTVFPLLGVVGTLISGVVSDRFSGGRRGPIISLFLACLVLTLWALSQVGVIAATVGLEESTLAMICIGLAGFFILGPYSMVGGGVVALDFGGQRLAATAAGLLDGVGYIGASLAGIGIARLVSTAGWDEAFSALLWITVASLALSTVLWRPTRPAAAA